MSNLLERYNRNFEKAIRPNNKEERVQPQSGNPLDRYIQAMREKTPLEVCFDLADEEGNLSVVDDNGVTLRLQAADFVKDNSYYNPKIKSNFIGLTLTLLISSIDELSNEVFMVSAAGKENIRGALMSEMIKKLNAGEHPVLWGTILFVNERKVTVNILNRNILGFINIHDWSKGYTRFLTSVAKKSEPVQFEVLELLPRQKGKDFAFKLSRKNVTDDPWEGIVDIAKDSILSVKCINKPIDKSYFWGSSIRVPGVDIMCDLNSALSIMEGTTYKCKVRVFDKEKHKLQVVPFDYVPTGIATMENIRFIQSRASKSK